MANALQIEFLAAGITDNNGNPLNGGKVYTYAAGTSSPKTCWTEGDKSQEATNPIILNTRGQANVYAEGNYKFVIKDSADNTIITLDNMWYIVLTPAALSIKSISANYTLTTEHNVVIINASAGNVVLTLYSASGEYREIVVKRIDSSSNTVTIDAYGSETIDGSLGMTLDEQYSAAHLLSDGSNWHTVTDNPDILGYPPTATPTASRIPIADASGLLDGWITHYVPRVGWKNNCVNAGAVDSNKRANFLAAGSGLSVNLDGTPISLECLINGVYCKRSADDTIDERIYDKSLSETHPLGIRYNSGLYQVACRIPDGEQWGGEIASVTVALRKAGSPTGNIWVELREDSSGEPGGLVTNGQSNNVDVSTLTEGSTTNQEFTFSTNPTLDKNKTYWLVINGDWAVSTSNYGEVRLEANYADCFGILKYNNGTSSWDSAGYDDGIFVFKMKYAELADDTTVFLWAEKPSSGEEISTLGFSVARILYGYDFNADISQLIHTTSRPMRNNSSTLQLGCGFGKSYHYGGVISSVKLWLKRLGSPTGNVWVEIRKDNAGDPGDLIVNGQSNNVDVSTISGGVDGAETEFTFSSYPVLMPGVRYWFIFNGDYTVSGINYTQLYYKGTVSTEWGIEQYNGSSWDVVDSDGGFYIVIAWEKPATDQHWYDMITHKMKRYTGSGWEEVNRIFIGEAVTASGSVSSVISYALRGEYVSGVFAVAASTAYEKTHNIGVDNRFIDFEVRGFYDYDYAVSTLDDVLPILKPVVGDADTNGFLFRKSTTAYRHTKIATLANPIDSDGSWQTSGYYYIKAQRAF